MTIKTHGRMMTSDTIGITQLALTDGTANQAIVTDGQGVLRFATVGAGGSVGSSVYVEDIRNGDGTTTTFTLSTAAPYEESILVFIDGVAQPTSSFTLPSTTSLTFSPAPGNGAAIRICHLGIASSIADNSITGAKIAMGGDTPGDVLFYNGTDYQRLTIGTAAQVLATNNATNAPEWINAATASLPPTGADGNILTSDGTNWASEPNLGGASPVPTGVVNAYAGATAPTGWLLCYGQAISRTTYSALFTAISTTYGVGNGTTTFTLPDMRGRTVAGQDDMGGTSADRLTTPINGDTLGAAGGTEAHVHTNTSATGTFSWDTTGTMAAGTNIQPTIVLNYIIKT